MNMKAINALLAAALCAAGLTAHAAITKEEHKAAVQNAEMSYKTAKAACASLAGNAKDVCIAEAQVQKTFAIAKSDSIRATLSCVERTNGTRLTPDWALVPG